MVVYYQIFGQKVGSHMLAIGVLSTMGVGIWSMTGGKKTIASAAPPINASSKDEESFIQEFIKQAEADGKGAKH